jgi:hypothetical protein
MTRRLIQNHRLVLPARLTVAVMLAMTMGTADMAIAQANSPARALGRGGARQCAKRSRTPSRWRPCNPGSMAASERDRARQARAQSANADRRNRDNQLSRPIHCSHQRH